MRINISFSAFNLAIVDDDGLKAVPDLDVVASTTVNVDDENGDRDINLHAVNLKSGHFIRTAIIDPLIDGVSILRDGWDPEYTILLPLKNDSSEFVVGGGVGVIIGGTGSGKSTFIHHGLKPNVRVANADEIDIVDLTYMEDTWPGSSYIADPASLILLMVARAIRAAINQRRTIIVVDSFREAMYLQSKDFAAGEGGLSMGFPLQLTSLSHLYEMLGVVLVGAVNPMIDSETKREQYDRLVANFRASITFTVSIVKENHTRTATWEARGLNNLHRPSGEAQVLDLSMPTTGAEERPGDAPKLPDRLSDAEILVTNKKGKGRTMDSVTLMAKAKEIAGFNSNPTDEGDE